jgi:hypothetical protein
MRLHPGDTALPGAWLAIVLAAFHPDATFASLSWERTLGGAELPNDEWAFRRR